MSLTAAVPDYSGGAVPSGALQGSLPFSDLKLLAIETGTPEVIAGIGTTDQPNQLIGPQMTRILGGLAGLCCGLLGLVGANLLRRQTSDTA